MGNCLFIECVERINLLRICCKKLPLLPIILYFKIYDVNTDIHHYWTFTLQITIILVVKISLTI